MGSTALSHLLVCWVPPCAQMAGAVTKSDIVNWALTTLYGLLILYALVARFGKTHPRTKMVHQYCMLVIVGSVLRGLYFGIPPSVDHQSFTPANHSDRFKMDWWIGDFGTFLLFSIGSWFFYSQYCLIVYFWAQAFFSTRRLSIQRRPTQFFAACVILYALALVTCYGLFAKYQMTQILSVYSAVSLTLSVLVAVGFLTFWTKLSNALGQVTLLQNGPAAATQTRKLHKIASVAIAGASAAIIRACVLTYQMVASATDHFPHKVWWLIVFLFYLTAELSCSFAILFVLRKRQPATVSDSRRSNPGGVSGGDDYDDDYDDDDDQSYSHSYADRTDSPYTSLYDDSEGGGYGTTDEFASPPVVQGFARPAKASDSPMWESPYFSPS